jgi:hypothetical protein
MDGEGIAFTLDPNHEVERKSRGNPERLFRAIVGRIGRDVPFLMVCGVTPMGRLHIHGAFRARSRHEHQKIERTIRAVGGIWEKDGYQFAYKRKRLGRSGPPGGWGWYMFWHNLKHAERVLESRPLWNATGVLRRATRALYHEMRVTLNATRRAQLAAKRSGVPFIQDAPPVARPSITVDEMHQPDQLDVAEEIVDSRLCHGN